jgi:hypothetical protein
VGDDPIRRDASPVELSDPFDLIRPEAGQIAVNLFDGCSFAGLRYFLRSYSSIGMASSTGCRSSGPQTGENE